MLKSVIVHPFRAWLSISGGLPGDASPRLKHEVDHESNYVPKIRSRVRMFDAGYCKLRCSVKSEKIRNIYSSALLKILEHLKTLLTLAYFMNRTIYPRIIIGVKKILAENG